MSNTNLSKTIEVEPLTVLTFAPYGQAIIDTKSNPNYRGDGWESLFPVANLHLPDAQLGWVKLTPTGKTVSISGMEREPEVEIIWAVDRPIIQAVALPGNLSDHTQQPHIENVKAFLIQPGQVIIMHPGTWHYAAIPATDQETLYFFATKDHPREPGWENVPWVPFKKNCSIIINRKVFS